MKLLFTILISSQIFAVSYGFLSYDRNYNRCFVGVNSTTLEYDGLVLNRLLNDDQREVMAECQSRKANGEPTVIKVWTTSNTQEQPSGIITHFPDYHVECIELSEREFGRLLGTWRNEVKNSTFRRCY